MKSNAFGTKVGAVLVLLALVTTMGIACGGGETPPATPPSPPGPGGNQPPVISSLTAAQMQVYPSGQTEIQCAAADPDGDAVTFKWATTGGSFTGAGRSVIWKAPENYGTYDVTVTVEDGKGASVQATLTLSVTANQPPQISSLVAEPATVLPKGSSIVTCVASDPDGDIATYSWTSSEGSITGVGNKVTWVAPTKGGTYNILVTVSDGKGGETTGNIVVTVASATKTVTINVVDQETGTVSSTGDKDASRIRAGDDENNNGYRAFWSFNIYSLVGSNIEEAKLTFNTKSINGKPFEQTGALNGLRLWQVKYGQDKLPDYSITGGALQKITPVVYEPPVEIDVTPEISHLISTAANRFQVEALFVLKSNGSGTAEYIEWFPAELTVTYTEK